MSDPSPEKPKKLSKREQKREENRLLALQHGEHVEKLILLEEAMKKDAPVVADSHANAGSLASSGHDLVPLDDFDLPMDIQAEPQTLLSPEPSRRTETHRAKAIRENSFGY